MRNLLVVAAAGLLVTIAGMMFEPARTWPGILLAACYVVGLSAAAGVFIALQYVSNAGWSVAFRRVPEAMAAAFPVGALCMILVLPGVPMIYEWSRAGAASADHLLAAKSGWLNVPFFTARTAFYLLLWGWLLHRITATSRLQDAAGDLRLTGANKRNSVVYIVTFALTFTLASMDWIMSLEPRWYSTIFGIYNFSGVFLNGLAAITILAILLRRSGHFREVLTDLHLLNLGKLIFAFSTFWMYIWFSQYLLIWYANIPEEVTYFVNREQGTWVVFTVVNVVFNWAIPFVVLLPQWTKKNEGLLLRVCVIVLTGRWIDLSWMILPPFMRQGPEVFLWEILPMAGVVAVFFYVVFRALSLGNVVPVNDPFLVESLSLH
jgi:hypothetical protein